ncbi:hypothetical protein J2127_001064 [Methanococcus voltae]|uniref:hypothetical protein n=1 Tax=Methanococcus voltae TaxID=2188 RepID=UPI001AE94A20|nr:hypothetical protein [Methanococcus voltae]MBP2143895.1 hypothetical protein [Methanococcus voltae]
MGKLEVKLKNLDDELALKELAIKIGSKKITTPSTATFKRGPPEGINEVYKEFTFEKLNEAREQLNVANNLESNIRRRCNDNGLNIVIPAYDHILEPDQNCISEIADLCYPYTDVMVIPSMSKYFKKNVTNKNPEDSANLIERVLDFNTKYIDYVNIRNHKPIIGSLSISYPRAYLDKIIDFYIANGIDSFVVDMEGRGTLTNKASIEHILKKLHTEDIFESCMIYGINIAKSRYSKDNDTKLAQDFISSFCGFDVIGMYHLRSPPFDKMYGKNKPLKHRTYDLFSNETYGYYKVSEERFKEEYPKYSDSDINILKKGMIIYDQNEEFDNVKMLLNENNNIVEYIKPKSCVEDKHIKNMAHIRKEIR